MKFFRNTNANPAKWDGESQMTTHCEAEAAPADHWEQVNEIPSRFTRLYTQAGVRFYGLA
ncbi:MAG: hypothetical protein P4L10_11005 [Acidobacteriaceae bacterium]|nr:hypothetical protein [Acidobacteriaceae bacterium]